MKVELEVEFETGASGPTGTGHAYPLPRRGNRPKECSVVRVRKSETVSGVNRLRIAVNQLFLLKRD